MSPVRDVGAPAGVLYRIGYASDPLAWPPWEYVGVGRFDDYRRQFRVLYVSEQRRACFLEGLAQFRPDPEALTRLSQVSGTDEPIAPATVPPDWYRKRAVGTLVIHSTQGRWLDLRQLETREALRTELAQKLVELGLEDLDVSDVRSRNRELTQAIARWAYEQGYQGIVYKSRFDDSLDCWAIFEGALVGAAAPPEPISRDDPDLRVAAQAFGIVV